ncbi:hypothetical protein EV363DRAFT_1435963 [Boletus edulis]|nr:hypothetical protein EV363DRAFT_1435963 [Boletus edulis]
MKKLEIFWRHKRYLIIDEKSMLSRKFLARVSASISTAKNFHQFPPVIGRPLYWSIDPTKDDGEDLLGRSLYEQFKTVRVNDTEWLDLLRHVRNGNCRAQHIKMLRSLIITNPESPPTDFATCPWNEAVLITPRHAVRRHWNDAMAKERCRQNGNQLLICRAHDTIGGRPVTLSERFAIASKSSNRGRKQDEHGGLPNETMIAVGMKVMVTYNIETDLDIANGARGEIVKIILDEREEKFSPSQAIIHLDYPPAYILVKMLSSKNLNQRKATSVARLEMFEFFEERRDEDDDEQEEEEEEEEKDE